MRVETVPDLADAASALSGCRYREAAAAGLAAGRAAVTDGRAADAARAYLIAGRAFQDLGNYTEANRWYRRGLDAVAAGPRSVSVEYEARLHHALFGAHLLSGSRLSALFHLDRARTAPQPDAGRRAALDSDAAFMLLDGGEFAKAADALSDAAGRIVRPEHLVRARANLYVALAGAGSASAKDEGDRLESALAQERLSCVAWLWCAAGWGHALSGEVRPAQSALVTARRMAARTGDEYTRARAAALLRAVSSRR